MTLDEAIKARPDFGFAFYAYSPGQDVTLEIHTPEGDIFTFTGESLEAVLVMAFGNDQHTDEIEDAEEIEDDAGDGDIFG